MRPRVIVVKLGGSVLTNREALVRAVHEIYRWHRRGWRVVAVPSALSGVTDARLRAATSFSPRIGPGALAATLAIGEAESAAELGVAIDRAGIPATVLSPGSIGLRADGHALDAIPRTVGIEVIERALDRGVVVVPGFTGIGQDGASVTLGRGGSDLSALFLADALRADRCRLVKDVDGLYVRDPSAPGPKPDRYASITWDDALRLDGSIVQHKAIAFARDNGVVFEVGSFNGVRPTIVGPGPTTTEPHRESESPITVALIGLGIVGGGVHAHLRDLPGFRIIAASARDVNRARRIVGADVPIKSPVDAAESGATIVIEAMGGVDPAREVIERALRAGSHVVTANKAVIAAHGPELSALAHHHGVRLLYSAAVGGSVPVIERVRTRAGMNIASIRGVVNGTANFVIDRVRDGSNWDRAIEEARLLGLAEADPSRDLDGRDAADKIAVIALAAGIAPPDGWAIPREVLTCARLGDKLAECCTVRQVAAFRATDRGCSASVLIEPVATEDPLRDVREEQNAVEINWNDGTSEVVRGIGAGRWPTAESVVGDVLEIARVIRRERHATIQAETEVAHGAA